jgi:hypothetical protein
VEERRDLCWLGVADLEVAERVGTELCVGSAERGENAEDKKLAPGVVEPGAGVEVAEAELGEQSGHGVTEAVGESARLCLISSP